MTINPELLKILVCPETHQPLAVCDAAMLGEINAKIAAGKLKTRGGKSPTGPLSGGLIRKDSQVVYPITEGIPVLLVDEGILV